MLIETLEPVKALPFVTGFSLKIWNSKRRVGNSMSHWYTVSWWIMILWLSDNNMEQTSNKMLTKRLLLQHLFSLKALINHEATIDSTTEKMLVALEDIGSATWMKFEDEISWIQCKTAFQAYFGQLFRTLDQFLKIVPTKGTQDSP